MELQQSSPYQQYIRALKWNTIVIDGAVVFYRYIFLMGTLAKIQRPEKLPKPSVLIPTLKKLRVRQLVVEAKEDVSQKKFDTYIQTLSKHFHVILSPFLPTKTILVAISKSEDEIFNSLTSPKRRAIRRARNNGVTIIESHTIADLIKIKSKSAGLFGSITTYGIDKLWQLFFPKHATILLAVQNSQVVGGVLELFWNKTAYYWIAGATRHGKKLFAPTLLVWHALCMGKKHNCTSFDFVGVWDERTPTQFNEWKGFTKFKEGFGGTPKYYPISRLHK